MLKENASLQPAGVFSLNASCAAVPCSCGPIFISPFPNDELTAAPLKENDVDMIVTEYGIAKLRGRTLKQRTRALIGIAHPNFRDELVFEAKKRQLLL